MSRRKRIYWSKLEGVSLLEEMRRWCVITPQGCWLWQRETDKRGYGMLPYRGRRELVHRLMFKTQHEAVLLERRLLVCHTCDVKGCCNPAHLFLGTNTDNMRDCSAKGRTSRGERRWSAKIKTRDVFVIRFLHASGEKQRVTALRYGLTRQTVNDIVNRKRWKHV